MSTFEVQALEVVLGRKGQLEIGVQEARKIQPDLSDDALLELAKELV